MQADDRFALNSLRLVVALSIALGGGAAAYAANFANALTVQEASPSFEDRASLHLVQMTTSGKRADPDQVIAYYTEQIRQSPNNAEAYNLRGRGYSEKGNHDHAIADFNMAIRLNPNHAIYYNNRGASYVDKGAYDRALRDLNKAIQLDPKYAFSYRHRGRARMAKEDYKRAVADFTKAISLHSKYNLAIRDRGFAYEALGELTLALKDLTVYALSDPRDVEVNSMIEVLQDRLYDETDADNEEDFDPEDEDDPD